MKITGIEAIAIGVPVKGSFWVSLQPMGGGKAVTELIVKVHTDDGAVGLGEGHGGPPLAAAKLIQSELQALLIGEDPLRPEYLWQKLFAITHTRRSAWEVWGINREQLEVAMAALDIALWDLVGKQAGLPLYRLLGGYTNQVPAYVTGGYYQEGKGIPDLIAECQGYVEAGFKAVKIKVGGTSLAEDVERVRALRQALGDGIDIMLDANRAWDVKTAIEAAQRFEPYQPRWLEEPLHWYDDIRAMTTLKHHTRLPLASGESARTRFEARELIEQRAIDIMQFDGTKNGGITEWRKIAGMCSMYHVDVAPHHDPQIHGHLVAAVPHGLTVESFHNPARDPLWPDLYAESARLEGGVLCLSERPGLGINFNEDFVRRYRQN
jgi:L-alanine-DL-glutamate epimerase-like enolase superfamily enzyme